MAYNKDLQESQEPLFDSVETLDVCLQVATGMVASLQFDGQRTRNAVDSGYLVATEVADYLVDKGLPFRQAHDIAGALVKTALDRKVELKELSVDDFRAEHELFADDIYQWLDVKRALDRRDLPGGPARSQVDKQIARWRNHLAASQP